MRITTLRVLVYAPYSFNGRGPAESCARILEAFPHDQTTEVFAGRFRRAMPGQILLRPSLPHVQRRLPWRFVEQRALEGVDRDFRAQLRNVEPESTVAWFWPDPPVDLVEETKNAGVTTIREMINSACATSGPLLDRAYGRLGLPPTHPVTKEKIEEESRELAAHDFFFASNPEVETSLADLGIGHQRVLATSFGWSPSRFDRPALVPPGTRRPRVLFVGTLSVRKGVPDLLDAWREADVDADLLLAGGVEPAIEELVDKHSRCGNVHVLGYVEDVASLFRDADVFVFPTHEEGGPQVTYEAAGCGLPVITTPMGAARLVETGVTGVVVPPGSVSDLKNAIRQLVADPGLRAEYGANARERAAGFTYRIVGKRRHEMLLECLARRQSS